MPKHRWIVACDDERWEFRTRAEARAWARKVGSHPANADIRAHGPYTNVDGIARVIDRHDVARPYGGY